MNLSIKERRIIFQILSLIMNADSVIKPEETAFLDKVFNDFHLSIDEFDHMDNLDLDSLIREFATLDTDKKEYAQPLFLEMAKCDGYVDPREMSIIERLK